MNKRALKLKEDLSNPSVRKFLDLIAVAEGTEGNNPSKHFGYATGFGGVQIGSLADHPRTRKAFTQTDGKRNTSSAAGRYQFIEKTWNDLAKSLGLSDFGPESQDIAALELLRRAGALDQIKKGNFQEALRRSGKTWASLPSSPYPQPKRSEAFINDLLQRSGLTADNASAPESLYADTSARLLVPDTGSSYRDIFGDLVQSQQPAQSAEPEWRSALTDLAAQDDIGTMLLNGTAPANTDSIQTLRDFTSGILANQASDAQRSELNSMFPDQPAEPTSLQLPQPVMASINRMLLEL